MRAEPPPPPRGRRQDAAQPRSAHLTPGRRCPYLEQVIKGHAGPFGWLVRYRADCHVDRRTHSFTGRHPRPPCISDPTTCGLYQTAKRDEDRQISRYTD